MATATQSSYPIRCPKCDIGNQSHAHYCRSCGHPIKPRRIVTVTRYHVSYYLDDLRFKLDQTFTDYSDALAAGIGWIDHGPVAKSREIRISRSIDDQHDPSFCETRRYDNYKQRRKIIRVDGDCPGCKGKGYVRVTTFSGHVDVMCTQCGGMMRNRVKIESWGAVV